MSLNRGWKSWIVPVAMVAIGAGVALGTVGCEPRELKTGTVDTAKLLQYDEEYQKLAKQYFDERIKLTNELRKAVASTGGEIRDQATYDKFTKAEADLNKEWTKITHEFIERKMDKVEKACAIISKNKGIDLVLLDSPQNPVVESGAVDISSDVMVELSGFAGSNTKPANDKAKADEVQVTETDKGKS